MSTLLARSSVSPSVAPVSGPRLPRVQAFGLSHQGMLRSTNEDAYAVIPELGLFIVADGVGGRASGEVASRLAVDSVRAVFEDPELTWPGGLSLRPTAVDLPLLRASVERANACVHGAGGADPAKKGMGTTLSAMLVLEDRVALAHVGDSRIYGLRGRRLQQLTYDHTLANSFLHAGILRQEDVATSQHNHTLTRAVGTEEIVEIDTRLVGLEPGDTFLLASDGLHGVVDEDEIAAILFRERDLTVAAARLVDRANELGGPNNVTAVLVRVV